MKRKNALITAVICMGIGLLTVFTGLLMIGFDLTRLNSTPLESKYFETDQPIHSIEILDAACNVNIVPTSNSTYTPESDLFCQVYYREGENYTYSIQVDNGKLTISASDTRNWHECIGFQTDDAYTLTVAVPAFYAEGSTASDQKWVYDSLSIETTSGDITVSPQFSVREIILRSTSGDICCEATGVHTDGHTSNYLSLDVQTTSGDIEISRHDLTRFTAGVAVRSTSGDIQLSAFSAATLSVETKSGDVDIQSVNAEHNIIVQSTSGDLTLKTVTMDTASLKSVSGDIFLAQKEMMNYITTTSSGDVQTPGSNPSMGVCELITTSGDIIVQLRSYTK